MKCPKFIIPDENSKFLFLGAFLSQISFIINSLLLFFTKKPVSHLFEYFFTVVSFILLILCISLYFRKTSKYENKISITGNIISAAANFFILLSVILVFSLLLQQYVRFLPYIEKRNIFSILIVSAYIVLIIIMQIFSFSVLMLFTAGFEYNLNIKSLGSVYRAILILCLKKFFTVFIYSTILSILLALAAFAQFYLNSILESVISFVFLKNFIYYIMASLINGYILVLCINMARNLLNRINEKIVAIDSNANKFSIPILPIFSAAISIIIMIILVPPVRNAADGIVSEIKFEAEKAEALGRIGYSTQSIYYNSSAYSKIIAFKGYLEGLKSVNGNKELRNSAFSNLDAAYNISPKNPYIPYFRGNLMLILEKNYDSAINHFNSALLYKDKIPESYFGLLEAYREKKQNDKVLEIINILIRGELYYDGLQSLKSLSSSKIDSLIEKLNEIEAEVGPKHAYKAVERTKYLDYKTAASEIAALEKKYPKSPIISYYMAKLMNEFKNEQSNYAKVKEYASKFNNQLDSSSDPDSEINKKLFIASMYLSSDDPMSAEQILRELYSKYKDNYDVSSQYARTLIKNKKFDEALNVVTEMKKKNKDDYLISFLESMCYLNKKNYSLSFEAIRNMVQITSNNKDLYPKLDEFIYAYSLAFTNAFSDKSAVDELEKIKDDIVYNYVYAMKWWKERNNEKSIEYLKKVIDSNKELGYAYYVIGVNYYEEAIRKNTNDFSNAEKYYLKSLSILPNHTEGYFALAHCYKKWGKNLEALRMFRKVADLLPFEDHRTDPYGMTVHALGEIYDLSKFDVKGD